MGGAMSIAVGAAGAATVELVGVGATVIVVKGQSIAEAMNGLISEMSSASNSDGKGTKEEGDSEAKCVYEPSPKHNPQGGWGSENPIPNNEVGQELLDSAYSSSKNKQLYNMYEGDIIKFQPDSSSGKWHAYKVSNTAKEVPTDVYKKC